MLPLIGFLFWPPKQDVRNLGIVAWMRCWGSDNATLAKFLKRLPRKVREKTKTDIRAATNPVESFLFERAETEALDMPAFLSDLRLHIGAAFPWVSDSAFQSFESYCQWMAWHEGFCHPRPAGGA